MSNAPVKISLTVVVVVPLVAMIDAAAWPSHAVESLARLAAAIVAAGLSVSFVDWLWPPGDRG